MASHPHQLVGVDAATGMHRETLSWAIDALFRARPDSVAEHPFWLNALSGLAAAYVRAGGSMSELEKYERDGFFWGPALSR